MSFLGGILALCTSLSAVAAEAADPSVEVIPPDVAARTLPKDTPIELEVHLKAGDSEVTDISISWFSNNGINAELANETPAELRQLAPKSEHSWRLKLTGDGRSVLTNSTLHIRLAFDVAQTAAPADGVRPAPTHRLTTLRRRRDRTRQSGDQWRAGQPCPRASRAGFHYRHQ